MQIGTDRTALLDAFEARDIEALRRRTIRLAIVGMLLVVLTLGALLITA